MVLISVWSPGMKVLCFCQTKKKSLCSTNKPALSVENTASCLHVSSVAQSRRTKPKLFWCFEFGVRQEISQDDGVFAEFSGRQFLCFSKQVLTRGGCQARPLEATVDNGEGKEPRQGFCISAFMPILKYCTGKGWRKCRHLKRNTNVSLPIMSPDGVKHVLKHILPCQCSQLAKLSVARATDGIVSSLLPRPFPHSNTATCDCVRWHRTYRQNDHSLSAGATW